MSSSPKTPGAPVDESPDPNAVTVYTPSKPTPGEPPDPNAATVYTPKEASKPAPKSPSRAAPRPAVQSTPPSGDDENATMHVGHAGKVARRRVYPWPLSWFSTLSPIVRVLVLLIAGLGVGGAVVMFLPAQTPGPKGPPPPPTQADRTGDLLVQARQASANRQFAIAAAAFEAVVHLDPGNAEAKEGLAKSKEADAQQSILDAAGKLVSSKHYAEARDALKQIPATSAQAPAARALWTQADHEESQALFAQGTEQLKQGKLAEVKASIEKLKPLDEVLTAKLSAALEDAKH